MKYFRYSLLSCFCLIADNVCHTERLGAIYPFVLGFRWSILLWVHYRIHPSFLADREIDTQVDYLPLALWEEFSFKRWRIQGLRDSWPKCNDLSTYHIKFYLCYVHEHMCVYTHVHVYVCVEAWTLLVFFPQESHTFLLRQDLSLACSLPSRLDRLISEHQKSPCLYLLREYQNIQLCKCRF